MSEIDDLIKNFNKTLKKVKEASCKRCGEEPKPGSKYCQSCLDIKEEDRVKRLEGRSATSQAGYEYRYDSTGKLRIASRVIMEEILQRPLREYEVVMYRDGDKKNLDSSNLILGWKAGIPLDFLTCACCGARGNTIVDGPPKES